ncbi:uncharacterized protein N7511_002611 [Penicillium nucicola]|uniref:uncharacterized protein n=1 Tax=Penicillium nucicola TaxID=1850975 RepID=UPI002545AF56|nr:uncharacterized protein N7511_002611 [Penicillium nucicola]KAJ5770560.1 hypothetical protein N7511_002611 [Penicillium nucicola]
MGSEAQDDLFKPYDQFILFGDSITQMACNQELGFAFHAALQESYSRRLDVVNRGLAGYTTAHAVKVFDKFFPRPETATVRFMTIFFGANDASPSNARTESADHLDEPTPINEYQLESFDAAKDSPHPSRTASGARLYADAAREVGAELNIPVADLWPAFMKATGWKEGQALVGSRDAPNSETLSSLLTDGLHLTPAGYRIVYDEVMKVIEAHWPDQMPDNLPMVFPSWLDAPK